MLGSVDCHAARTARPHVARQGSASASGANRAGARGTPRANTPPPLSRGVRPRREPSAGQRQGLAHRPRPGAPRPPRATGRCPNGSLQRTRPASPRVGRPSPLSSPLGLARSPRPRHRVARRGAALARLGREAAPLKCAKRCRARLASREGMPRSLASAGRRRRVAPPRRRTSRSSCRHARHRWGTGASQNGGSDSP